MADRFKYSEVRQHIIDDMRTDLIGPMEPYEVRQSLNYVQCQVAEGAVRGIRNYSRLC